MRIDVQAPAVSVVEPFQGAWGINVLNSLLASFSHKMHDLATGDDQIEPGPCSLHILYCYAEPRDSDSWIPGCLNMQLQVALM
jgi:hypothetical protein